jgi:PEP-CTERM motif
MMRFALSMFVLTLLAPQTWVLGASYEDVRGPKDKAEKNKGPQGRTEERNGEPVAVPEPATLALLGTAAASAAVARKLWRNRQR